jgi:hypothetical protein
MSLSAGLSTLIAVVFVFGLLALFCSALTETASNLLEKRARYLLTGLRSMLDQPESGPPTAAPADANPGTAEAGADAAPTEPGADVASARAGTGAAPAGPDQDVASAQAGAGAAGTAGGRRRMPTGDDMHARAKDGTDTARAADRVRDRVDAAYAGDIRLPGLEPGDLTLALFGHPLIRSLQVRRVRPGRRSGKVRNPQYLPPPLFAKALIDTLVPRAVPGTASDEDVLAALARTIDRLGDALPARQSLLALIQQASGDLQRFEASVESWYDGQMGRISGWYKRWSKVVLGLTGLVIAIVANVDTLQLAHGLYVDEPVRQAVVAHATSGTTCEAGTDPAEQRRCVQSQIAIMDSAGLPIWYPSGCSPRHWSTLDDCWNWYPGQPANPWRVLLKLLGWGLTGFAVSFGAPFWFDALSRLGSLRTTGPKPAT